jgi:hypothetical protein
VTDAGVKDIEAAIPGLKVDRSDYVSDFLSKLKLEMPNYNFKWPNIHGGSSWIGTLVMAVIVAIGGAIGRAGRRGRGN